ncbi:MAG: hypothetical protein Q9168_005612 [Polycauliona sp. 1 TL-2023]
MAQSSLAKGGIPFALNDGTTGIIDPESRRTYDHIIQTKIGNFPLQGLTDVQMKLILAVSTLSQDKLEDIWQRTLSITAVGLQEGFWTLLEIYVALYFVQSSERRTLDQMAVQFAGSMPPQVSIEMRRKSTYIRTSLAAQPGADHDPVSASPSPALTAKLRHSVSNATSLTGLAHLRIDEEPGLRDDTSSSQPGLEVHDLLHPGFHHSNQSRRIHRSSSSQRTSSTVGAQRLATLIQSRCPSIEREPEIGWAPSRPVEPTINDTQSAKDILIRNRRRRSDFTDPSTSLRNKFRSKQVKQKLADTSTWRFELDELDLALKQVVAEEQMGNAGVAKALITLGADVTTVRHVQKSRLGGARVDSDPINYARIAASHNNLDMVYLFATTPPVLPANLVAALEQAVEQNLPRIVLALLQLGVNWSPRGEPILSRAITSQNPLLVRHLLRSRSATQGDLLTKCLPVAVEQGQVEIVSLLVTYGARTSVNHLSALRKAVQLQRVDIVLTMMKGIDSSGQSQVTSAVIGDAFSTGSLRTADQQYLLVEILLCAGAKGDPVAQLLSHLVRARHRSLVKLLIKYGANLRFHNAEALRIAMASKDKSMLSTLLLGEISKEIAGDMVDAIPLDCTDEQTYDTTSLLIAKGAEGGLLDRALVRAVHGGDQKTLALLLDHGVDVNKEGCHAIRMAVTAIDVATLQMLLAKGRPDPKAMQDLLPLIPHSPLCDKLIIVESIIHAAGQQRFDTAILNDALLDALRCPSRDEIEDFLIPLVDLLITTGASVDVQQGKCLRLAAETGSLALVKLLISSMSDQNSLSPAVEVSRTMEDADQRRDFLRLLAKHGARGREIDQALVDSLDELPVDQDLLHVLLINADMNYAGGRALIAAMWNPSPIFVAMIIDTGRTSSSVRLNGLQTLFEPRVKRRREKANILLQAGVGQEGLDKALIQEIGGKRDSHIVKLLLDHKASCDYDGGDSLVLALHHRDATILEQLVARCPQLRTIQEMVPSASAIEDAQLRLRCFSLLVRGGATGEPLSRALLQEVEGHDHRSLQVIQFLLQHGAQVDYQNAKAVKFVVSAPLSVELLTILLSAAITSTLVAALIPLALNHPEDIRLPLLQVLLDQDAHEASLNEALVSMASEGATAQQTIGLLLEYGASVNHCGAQAVKVAAAAKSFPILRRLLDQNPREEFLEEAIPAAMQLHSRPSSSAIAQRLQIVRLLTEKLRSSSPTDEPLIQAVREEDNELIEYWMKCGANPNYKDGTSVFVATQQLNLGALRHLFCSKVKPTSDTCSLAFAAMPSDDSRWHTPDDVIGNFDRIMIMGGAAGPCVDQAFLSAMASTHERAATFVRLILDNQTPLDANFVGGNSLCIAITKARIDVIAYLLQQTPDARTLHAGFLSIFQSTAEEQILIRMAREFFTCPDANPEIYFQQDEFSNDALYQLLHRHSDKPNLLQELLANGCRPESHFEWKVNESCGTEHTSALLWLLCQGKESIDVDFVDILLSHGADPNFRTPRSCISPLTIAASLGRGDIVLKLLEKGADPDTHDGNDRSPLEYATMARDVESMGCIINYKSNGHDNLNEELLDESLHIAAKNLDIAAIRLLLEHRFRPDLPGPVHAGGRTALAEACRMGDAAMNSSQLKKTLALLCKATADLEVRTDGKSLVLLALDNRSPTRMTTALLASCPAIRDRLNESLNLFSKGSYRYSLTAYVRHFQCVEPRARRCLDLSKRCCTQAACDGPKLERLLRSYGCQDRYWDSDAGGSQPEACCNPPVAIVNAIKKAKAEHLAQAHKDQIRREYEAAADAERKKEEERLRRRKEAMAAERRADEERTAAELYAIEQRAQAEILAQQRLDETNRRRGEREYKTRRARDQEEQDDKERRQRERDRRAAATLKERSNIQIDQMRKEANLRKGVLQEEKRVMEERRRLADSMGDAYRDRLQYGTAWRGRVLGEIED